MSKGWENVPTVNNSDYDSKKKKWVPHSKAKIARKVSDKALRNTKRLTEKQLTDEAENLYKEKILYEDALVELYNENKLKSKNLQNQAKRILKKRQKETVTATTEENDESLNTK